MSTVKLSSQTMVTCSQCLNWAHRAEDIDHFDCEQEGSDKMHLDAYLFEDIAWVNAA